MHDRELNNSRPRGLQGQDMLMSTMDYSRCLELAGGIPVAIPVLQSDEFIDDIASRLDGFLFSGGPDICPIYYGSAVKYGMGLAVPERDEFELKLLKKVLELKKPVFGICRGFQLINVLFGGTLHQDIKESRITELEHVGKMAPKHYKSHKVNIQKDSKVFEAYKTNELMVNSFHHQAVERLGQGLVITAKAEDYIIEAFEHKDYDFLVGVQWHPEMMAEVYDEQLSIFKLFVNITIEKQLQK